MDVQRELWGLECAARGGCRKQREAGRGAVRCGAVRCVRLVYVRAYVSVCMNRRARESAGGVGAVVGRAGHVEVCGRRGAVRGRVVGERVVRGRVT